MTANFDQVDFFSDASLLDDPYPYFEHLRSKCPVTPLPHHGVVAVSGHEEATDVYRNTETFSSCNSVIGPFATFPEPLVGDDVSPIIERYRHQLPMNEHMVTMDPPQHTQERALLMRLITPKRLKQNEDFMWRLADRQLDEFLDEGRCEFISAYSQPFAMLAVADLLGVPESEHQRFREGFGLSASPGELGGTEGPGLNALDWLDDYFATYVEDRRRQPRKDVLTDLALATYPDGSTPDVTAVVRTATFLFAAGQETTARLLATAMRYLCEYPQLQDELREHRERIPDFIEETLRIESPVKADFRLARRATTVGGVEIRPGTPVLYAEHELNASTFTTRVIAATLSDMHSAVAGGVGALKGTLHGGAGEAVMRTLLEIGRVDQVDAFTDKALAEKRRLMGFGHRVYTGGDPRQAVLKGLAEAACAETGQRLWYDIAVKLHARVQGRRS